MLDSATGGTAVRVLCRDVGRRVFGVLSLWRVAYLLMRHFHEASLLFIRAGYSLSIMGSAFDGCFFLSWRHFLTTVFFLTPRIVFLVFLFLRLLLWSALVPQNIQTYCAFFTVVWGRGAFLVFVGTLVLAKVTTAMCTVPPSSLMARKQAISRVSAVVVVVVNVETVSLPGMLLFMVAYQCIEPFVKVEMCL